MIHLCEEILEANPVHFGSLREEDSFPKPEAKPVAILTCMDARLDSAIAGLSGGDAYIVRNAGGQVSDDAIRSLVISFKLLGTREWFVIRHTDCKITKELIGVLLEDGTNASRPPEPKDLTGLASHNSEKSLVEDVIRIKSHPLVPARIAVYGFLYDVAAGTLREVPEATKAGAPIDLSECS